MFGALLAGTAQPAAAATTQIGAVAEIAAAEPPAPISAGGFVVQSMEATGTYAVPAGFTTITSWSHSAGGAAGALTLKVYRPTGNPQEYVAIASDTRDVAASSVQSFPVRIPVASGDRLGLSSDDVQLAYETFTPGDGIGFFSLDVPIGDTKSTDGDPFAGFKLDVAATLATPDDPAAQGPPGPAVVQPSQQQQQQAALARPQVTALRIAPAAFTAARSGPTIRPAGRGTPAASVSYRLNVAAKVRFTVLRLRPGRRPGSGDGARCVAQTRSNRSAPACTREIRMLGAFTRMAKPGVNRFFFSGRLDAAKLRPGRYRMVVKPSSNAAASTAAQRSFRIVTSRPAPR